MGTIRILLADDHPIVRDGLRLLLERAPDLAVVGEAGDGPAALRLATALRPDVLILDMALPGLSGVEVARQLQADRVPVRILALSAHDDAAYVRGALAAGAAGYLLKDEARQAIAEAVRGVARGERGWLSRRAAAHLCHPPMGGEATAGAAGALTPREREILGHLATGRSNAAIAAILCRGERTVEFHVANILAKLEATSRADAVRRGRGRGLLPPAAGNGG